MQPDKITHANENICIAKTTNFRFFSSTQIVSRFNLNLNPRELSSFSLGLILRQKYKNSAIEYPSDIKHSSD